MLTEMKTLVFSRRISLALWGLITVFYAAKTTFLLILATLYLNFRDTSGALNFVTVVFLYSESAGFLEANHKLIGTAYALLVVPFCYGFVRTVWLLGRNRFLTVVAPSTQANGNTLKIMRPIETFSKRLDSLALERQDSTALLLIFEIFEVSLQTWQAYRTSKSIGNLRVNQTYGIMILINCWSTSMIHYVWEHKRHNPRMARFLSVLVDLILGFVWGVVMQGMLLWPYWSVFLDQSKIGDMLEVPETPDRELQQILVLSATNFLLNVFPFFSSAVRIYEVDVACVGRTVNCSELGLHGSKTELTPVLESFSPYLLGNLAFTDCPALGMPSTLLEFDGVQTIAIRRSTLIEWTTDVAINETTFPALQSVQMIDSIVQCVPTGIMQHRFPSSFEWLRLKSTDVNAFIHGVQDAWWSTHYFHCIDCGLDAAPQAIEYIHDLIDLELSSNELSTLPASLVHGKSPLRYMTLAENRMIRSLDAEVWALVSQLNLLDIQGTNISTIPVDATNDASSDVEIWAFGTPLCSSDSTRPPQLTCEQREKSA
ncbi:TPA: hypothetical protein N0F65_009559 [Lagenidium giganteum]|uniref:Uncharacterized protein n=1 Tax=Lagenidium giganteum TaxID=4803 RepID=A0AAV2YQ89_9STRA|nr:TPA: hypothetical protein N0F65_009559 [Lagenidium giganteum]